MIAHYQDSMPAVGTVYANTICALAPGSLVSGRYRETGICRCVKRG
jgi:hypothetical protein